MRNEECHTADADRDENTLRVADANDPAANDAHHSPLALRADTAPARQSESELSLHSLNRSVHHSPKKDPAADPLQGLMGQIGQAVAECASPPTPIAPFNEVNGIPLDPSANDANALRDENPLHVATTNGPADSPLSSLVSPLQFKGIPYADIIAKYWEVMGGEPAVGERNTKLHQLAYHLRYICDFDANLLRQILPNYGLSDKEMHDLIQSALKAPRYSYSSVMNKVLKACNLPEIAQTGEEEGIDADQPPRMPDDLPPLIELLVRYMPEAYKPAVAHGVFPPLATHLCDTRFRYIDNVDHEATLMCLLMAGSSAGKGCMQRPIEYIMADIRQRDNENIAKEKEWKRTCNTLGSNERKPPRPEGLIIQEVDPDMTNPAFVMRMADAAPHPLYASMNEVEQFNNLRSSNGGKQQFQIMCYAFDPGNRYGQTRASSNAISEKVTVRFNWNASTTVTKGQRYFKSVVNDGPLSRINLCTIMPQAIGEQMPVYGIYPDDYPLQLQPYIENLCQANGLIDIPQASDLARRLVDHNALISSATQNRIYEQLSFRAAVIAWLKACLLYVAHGYYWDDRIDQFCLWSMDYDLWCKMRFFSQAMEEAMNSEQIGRGRGSNMLEFLSDPFTRNDLTELRKRLQFKTSVPQIISVWTRRGLILPTQEGNYRKVPQNAIQ